VSIDDQHLPSGWCSTDIGSLGNYLNGRGFKKAEWTQHGRPIIRIQNLTGSSDKFNYFEGQVDPKCEIEPGDLLMSWAATLGAYIWRGPSAVLNQHIFKVDSFIQRRFHYFILLWALDALHRKAHGSGMVHVTKGKFESTTVLLPPLPEQHRIVEAIESYVTRLDDAMATLERVQRNLKRYRASVLKAAVEGRLVPTEAELARAEGREYEPASVLLERILAERRRRWEEAELAKMQAKGKVPKNDKWKAKYAEPAGPDMSELQELPEGWFWATIEQLESGDRKTGYGVLVPGEHISSGVPLVRVGDINEGLIDGTSLKCIDHTIAHKFAKSYLQGGEVLLTLVGTIGRTGLVPPSLAGANVARAVGVIPQSSLLVPQWLELWLRSPDMRRLMISKAHEVARKTLNLEDVSPTHVALPPFSEQSRICEAVEDFESLIAALESSSKHSDLRTAKLRQSILKWAFEGRLVDQDPNDEPAELLLERIRAERAAAKGRKQPRTHRVNTRSASA
jgi:type I restriction enzyme, S subunit